MILPNPYTMRYHCIPYGRVLSIPWCVLQATDGTVDISSTTHLMHFIREIVWLKQLHGRVALVLRWMRRSLYIVREWWGRKIGGIHTNFGFWCRGQRKIGGIYANFGLWYRVPYLSRPRQEVRWRPSWNRFGGAPVNIIVFGLGKRTVEERRLTPGPGMDGRWMARWDRGDHL